MTDPHARSDRLGELEAEVAALRTDNARLRRLLDREGMPDALRHAFRDTVAMLQAIMRRTAETAKDVESYNAHLGGRLDAIVRVRNRTDAFGEAGLHAVIADALEISLLREDGQVALGGPDVRLMPKAAEIVGLAIHELATNAVEHGPLGIGSGRLRVAWSVEPGAAGPVLALRWEETGAAVPVMAGRRGFGTAVVEEMLAYDLAAEASLAFEPDGLICDIRLPLGATVGRVVEDASRLRPAAP